MIDILKIKQAIVDQATSGKLSKHFEFDADIKLLISMLPAPSSKREKLLKQKSEIEDELFEIPRYWAWVKLGEISSYGDTPIKTMVKDLNADAWVLELEDIDVGGKIIRKTRLKKRKPIGEKTVFRNGQLLYSKLRPYLKKVIVADEDGVSTPELIAFDVFCGINIKYIKLCLMNSWVDKVVNKRAYGIKMPRVDAGFMVNLPIPLPPIEEQNRIVDKVEEILAVLDNIDSLQSQYATNVEVLKSKLIDAAIRGKLTEQLPEDGEAEDLYNQIQDEKAKLIKKDKIKKEKNLPEITEDEIPFNIPQNWKWVHWGDLSESIQYGYNAPAKEFGRIKMVRISDIHDNKVEWENVPYCDISEEDISNYLLCENDILFARTGGTVGKSFLVKNVTEDAIYAGYLIRTRYSKKLVPEYMKYFMESQLYWKQLYNGTIATAQPNCNGKTLANMLLPLPPVAEQKRIVDRLQELILYCKTIRE